MTKCKNIVCYLLMLLLFVSATPVVAAQTESRVDMGARPLFDAVGADENTLAQSVNLDTLRAHLAAGFAHNEDPVNIASFGLPYNKNTSEALSNYIFHEMPESFHVAHLFFGYRDGIITDVYPEYTMTSSEYAAALAQTKAAADKLLQGVRGNSALSAVEKALVLHDRLALHITYDLEAEHRFTMYGPLVNRRGVCQGYAMAYSYLLEQVGIESNYCSSETMNHGWNIVYIDGKGYHVDVTWDDPLPDTRGRVYHGNFLRSTNALRNGVPNFMGNSYTFSAHTATDFEATPTSTKYDNAYWLNVASSFELLGDTLYYVDSQSKTIKEANNHSDLISVDDIWYAPGGGYWIGCYARLSSDGASLLYSKTDGIYRLNVQTKQMERIYNAGLTAPQSIFGFVYEGNELVLEIASSPNYSTDGMPTVRRIYYDHTPPAVNYTVLSNISMRPSIRIRMSDDTQAVGYYFGQNPNATYNTFYFLALNDSQYIDDSGTYYIVGKDTAGNLSQPISVTFCKVSLDANGGSVAASHVLATRGSHITLPTPIREGYYFLGWVYSALDSEGVRSIESLQENKSLCAMWDSVEEHQHNYNHKIISQTALVSPATCVTPAAYRYSCACAQLGSDIFYSGTTTDHTYGSAYDFTCNFCGADREVRYPQDVLHFFSDVKAKHWFYKNGSLNYAYNTGLLKGVSGGKIAPNDPVQRGMFVTILGRLHGVAVNNKVSTPFTDVKSGKYYTGYVKWASDNKIVNGLTATTFGPGQKVTREQICAMMLRYCDYADIKLRAVNAPITFADAGDISKFARTAIAACQTGGIVNGSKKNGKNVFLPKGNATRAEVATILMNFVKEYK